MNNRRCSLTIIKLPSRNIHDFTKVLSQNIYFGTEFQEITKGFCHESLELYSMCNAGIRPHIHTCVCLYTCTCVVCMLRICNNTILIAFQLGKLVQKKLTMDTRPT